MKLKRKRSANLLSWRRRVLGGVCCVLGLVWVGLPSFHSFCHFADLPHQHPTGSSYSHGHSHDGHDHHHGHDHTHPHDHGHSHSHAAPAKDLAGKDARENSQTPDSPDREPSDDAPFVFMQLLEAETVGAISSVVELDLDSPALEKTTHESSGLFSSVELGTIGARGPPCYVVKS